jgi:hypothetical protein
MRTAYSTGSPPPCKTGCLQEPQISITSRYRFAATLQNRLSAGTANLDHVEVDVRGKTLVEAQLLATEERPLLKGRVIEKAEVDCLFDLVDVLSGQDDPGDVCLDQLQAGYCMVVQLRILQRLDQRQLCRHWIIVLRPGSHRPLPVAYRLDAQLESASFVSRPFIKIQLKHSHG